MSVIVHSAQRLFWGPPRSVIATSKPATAGPWLQAMNRTAAPAARPCRPGEAFHLFEYPLDAAVQSQEQVNCYPRTKCQQGHGQREQ
jgi:hypothetical protein